MQDSYIVCLLVFRFLLSFLSISLLISLFFVLNDENTHRHRCRAGKGKGKEKENEKGKSKDKEWTWTPFRCPNLHTIVVLISDEHGIAVFVLSFLLSLFPFLLSFLSCFLSFLDFLLSSPYTRLTDT